MLLKSFAYYFDLIDPHTKIPWFEFESGSQLFDINGLKKVTEEKIENPEMMNDWIKQSLEAKVLKTIGGPLKAGRNYGLPLSWLRQSDSEWGEFVSWIKYSMISADNVIAIEKLGTP